MMRFSLSASWKELLVFLCFAGVGFRLFPWWLVLVQLVLLVVVWGFLGRSSEKEPALSFRTEMLVFLGLMALLIATRLFPFGLAGHPLGYDTGIYRYEIWSSAQALPGYVSDLFLGLPLLTNVGALFGLSADATLYGLYVLMSIVLGASLWALTRTSYGRQAALVSLALLVVSLAQFQAYSMILVKQVVSLSFVLMGFWLAERRSLLVLLPLSFMALLQPLDALFFGGALILWSVFRATTEADARGFLGRLLAVIGGVVFLLFLLDPAFWRAGLAQFFLAIRDPSAIESSLQQGVFFSLEEYGSQAAFLFVFGLLGWWKSLREKGLSVAHWYVLLLLAWIVLRLFFFQRLLIQLDVVLIVFAGYALASFFVSFVHDASSRWLFVVAMISLVVPFGYRLYDFQPSFSDVEVAAVESFCAGLPGDAWVGATDSAYAPWVRGFCLEQEVFGPGLFANEWAREDWEVFWEGADEKTIRVLLEDYPRPLYFYSKTGDLSDRLFEEVADDWYVVKE